MNSIAAHVESIVEVAGTTLVVRDWGPPDAAPVIFHHGTPSSSLAVPHGAGEAGRRVITFDRPGYGGSSNRPGRTVADAAAWSAGIADALGLDRFALMGTSGGGPHAAAAAALLGDRVTRLCICVGLGPTELDGFDVADGAVPETRDEIGAAMHGESVLRDFIARHMESDDPYDAWLPRLPAWDQDVLSRPQALVDLEVDSQEAMRGGVEGWLNDDLAFFHRPWGCDLSQVSATTLMVFGGADVLVPHTHGDAYLRAIGHGQLVKIPGAGHWMDDVEPAILEWLVSDGAAPAELS